MSVIKFLLRGSINIADRCLGLRKIMRNEDRKAHPLSGDRAIEWSWVILHLPAQPSHILDLGSVGSPLAGIASRLGHKVTAVDLNDIEYEMPNVTFSKGDINELNFDKGQFDVIMNCSMIEHVGLEHRYGSGENTDGDLVAMKRLSKLLAPDGRMILTIPVGIDAIFQPFHRIYGEERLPKLLADFCIIQEEFWAKEVSGLWNKSNKKTALSTKGAADYYAIGLYLLKKRN